MTYDQALAVVQDILDGVQRSLDDENDNKSRSRSARRRRKALILFVYHLNRCEVVLASCRPESDIDPVEARAIEGMIWPSASDLFCHSVLSRRPFIDMTLNFILTIRSINE